MMIYHILWMPYIIEKFDSAIMFLLGPALLGLGLLGRGKSKK